MDWEQISKLRQLYVSGNETIPDYWNDESLLDDYHNSLGQRIAWKWDSVLEILEKENYLRYLPKKIRIRDWGCGSGVATLRVLSALKDFEVSCSFVDRSATAVRFAQKKAKEQHPNITLLGNTEPADLLIVSHVLTELTDLQLQGLLKEIQSSLFVLWVEPGTSSVSVRLSRIRNQLLDHFSVLAPCPHQLACPLAASETDWCHFFAKAPQEAYQSKFWRDFADKLKIDVSSLPTSFVFLGPKNLLLSSGNGRLIGSLRKHKAYYELLKCSEGGIELKRIFKKDKVQFKLLKKPAFAQRLD